MDTWEGVLARFFSRTALPHSTNAWKAARPSPCLHTGWLLSLWEKLATSGETLPLAPIPACTNPAVLEPGKSFLLSASALPLLPSIPTRSRRQWLLTRQGDLHGASLASSLLPRAELTAGGAPSPRQGGACGRSCAPPLGWNSSRAGAPPSPLHQGLPGSRVVHPPRTGHPKDRHHASCLCLGATAFSPLSSPRGWVDHERTWSRKLS